MERSIRNRRSTPLVSVLEYILMLFVLLYSSLWSLFTSAGCNTFLRLGAPLLLVMICLRLRCQPLPAWRWQRALVLLVLLAVFGVATRFYNGVRYVLYYMIPLVLLTVYMGLVDERDGCFSLMYKLSDIVVVLAAVSLFCFLFGTCLGVLPGRQLVSYYWGEQDHTCGTYFYLYFESQSIRFLGQDFVRNCGLFAEAPGFAIFLVYAFSVETLLRPRIRVWRCLLLGMAALSTFSAKAILLTVIALALRFLITEYSSITVRKAKWIVMPLAAAVVLVAGVILLKDKATSRSFHVRVDDLLACLRAWRQNPLFGAGYWNDDAVIPFFTYGERYNNGLSMGVVVLLAEGGLYLTSLYFLPFIGSIFRVEKSLRPRVACFFIIYAGLLFVTNMPYSFLALFLMAVSFELCHRKKSPKAVLSSSVTLFGAGETGACGK